MGEAHQEALRRTLLLLQEEGSAQSVGEGNVRAVNVVIYGGQHLLLSVGACSRFMSAMTIFNVIVSLLREDTELKY